MLQVSAEERLKLLKQPPRSEADNIWKWADAFVNTDSLTRILTLIHPYLQTV